MSSLRYVDLGPILAGEPPDLSPIVLHTTDGAALLYRGINNLLGEPSLGKTLIAEHAAAEVLAAGGAVVMVDWEDTAGTFVERMRALGVPDDALQSSRVRYLNVDGALDDADRATLRTIVEAALIPDGTFDEKFDIIVSDDVVRAAIEHHVTYGCLPNYGDDQTADHDRANDEARRTIESYSALELANLTIGTTADDLDPDAWIETVPLERRRQVLVIIDAYAPALAADGAAENDNTEVTGWTNATLRPLARAGACVLVLDHVQKDPNARTRGGRGAGAKLALVDGTALEVRLVKAFSRGQAGAVKLVIAKDRPGLVGPIGATAALVHIEPTGDDGLEIRVEPPEQTTTDTGTFRPTHLMEKISIALERLEVAGERLPTSREIELDHVEGKGSAIRAGLRVLIDEGYVERVPGERGRIGHRSLRPFNASQDGQDQSASPRPDRVPTASRDALNPGASPRPPRTTSGDAGRGSNGHHTTTTDPIASHDTPDPAWAQIHEAIAEHERNAPIPDEELFA
jgi:hypothetical protein